MPAFKPQQRHLVLRGRALHFVSYEGRPANLNRGEDLRPPMWYLMVEGRRFPAMPCDPSLTALDVDRALTQWAEHNVLDPSMVVVPLPAAPAKGRPSGDRRHWWGPD